jgi:hypothetical protein
LTGEPQALTRYVLPESVAELVQLPGASGDSRRSRLAAVYGAIARVGIGYAVDEPSDEAGRQVVRSPAEVLWAPRHGTCLDLALVFAAACLKAGLHPVVVVLDAPSGLGAGHAVVLVRLDQDLTAGEPGEDPVWVSLPEPVRTSTQPDWDSDGDWVVVDPVGLSRSLGTARTRGLDADLPASVASGGRYLLGGADSGPWTWRVGVDIGSAWRRADAMDPGPRPGGEPLRPPYRAVGEAPSPLRLLRAEYGLVPFQARDELTILTD